MLYFLCIGNKHFGHSNVADIRLWSFSQLTGTSIYGAYFLLSVGVVIYTLFDGIKANVLTEFVHTCVIIGIATYLAFELFSHSDVLGSPDKV